MKFLFKFLSPALMNPLFWVLIFSYIALVRSKLFEKKELTSAKFGLVVIALSLSLSVALGSTINSYFAEAGLLNSENSTLYRYLYSTFWGVLITLGVYLCFKPLLKRLGDLEASV